MDTSIVALAPTVQKIGLGIILIVGIILGARVVGQGSRGFASLIMEVAGLLVGIYIVARPNDALNVLLHAVGGVQAPAALGMVLASIHL